MYHMIWFFNFVLHFWLIVKSFQVNEFKETHLVKNRLVSSFLLYKKSHFRYNQFDWGYFKRWACSFAPLYQKSNQLFLDNTCKSQVEKTHIKSTPKLHRAKIIGFTHNLCDTSFNSFHKIMCFFAWKWLKLTFQWIKSLDWSLWRLTWTSNWPKHVYSTLYTFFTCLYSLST